MTAPGEERFSVIMDKRFLLGVYEVVDKNRRLFLPCRRKAPLYYFFFFMKIKRLNHNSATRVDSVF